MKKILVLLLSVIMLACLAAFVACGSEEREVWQKLPAYTSATEGGQGGQSAAHVHKYEFTGFDWTKNGDDYTIKAEYTCKGCGADQHFTAKVKKTVTVEPTCEAGGEATYVVSYQGQIESKTVTLNALGHSWNTTDEKVICEEGRTCTVCEKHEVARGHNYEKTDATDADCTNAATETYTCSHCEDSYTDTIGAALGHTEGEEALVATENACEYIHGYTCTECGETITEGRPSEYLHKYTAKVTKEATCKEKGVKTYTCSVCKDSYTEDIEIDAVNGHDWDGGVVNGNVTTYTCKNCETTKKVIDASTVTEAAVDKSDLEEAGEIRLKDAAIALDKDTLGELGGTPVTLSADTFSKDDAEVSEAIEKLDDAIKAQLGDSKIYNFRMKQDGSTVSNFGGKVKITIPYELGANEDVDSIAIWYIDGEGNVTAIPATYSNGFVSFETSHFSLYTVTNLTPEQQCEEFGHDWSDTTVAATCTTDGYTIKTCLRCGATARENVVTASGHDYEKVETPATCTVNGSVTYTCKNCSHTYSETLRATGHNWSRGEEVAATCTEEGRITYVCTFCKEENVTIIEPIGHKYVDGVCVICGERDPDAPEEPETYYVKYLDDDVTVHYEQVEAGKCATEYTPDPKEGFTFYGWKYLDGSALFDFSTPITEDISLRAAWIEDKPEEPEPAYYTVNFYIEGSLAYTETVEKGEPVPAYQKDIEGYTFMYWMTEDGSPLAMGTVVTSDMNLIARYERNEEPEEPTVYMIVFRVEGRVVNEMTVENGVFPDYVYDREGYRFMYWMSEDGMRVEAGDPVRSDMNVEGMYREEETRCTIFFRVDGKVVNEMVVRDGKFPAYSYDREGYEFKYWMSDDGRIMNAGDSVRGDMTVEGRYVEVEPEEPETYYVKYLDDDVTVHYEQVEAGKCATEYTPDPKEGYTFYGWKYLDGSALFDFSTPITEDISLRAAWIEDKPEEFDVFFMDPDDGYKIVREETVLKGEKVAFFPYEKAGYRLVGWRTDDHEMFDFYTPVTTHLYLSAVWEAVYEEPEYYLVGSMTDWKIDLGYKFGVPREEDNQNVAVLYDVYLREGWAIKAVMSTDLFIDASDEWIGWDGGRLDDSIAHLEWDEDGNENAVINADGFYHIYYNKYLYIASAREESGTYTVRFYCFGDEVFREEIRKGESLPYVEPREREGYIFRYWETEDGERVFEGDSVYGDMIINARYERRDDYEDPENPENPYCTITFIVDGETVDTLTILKTEGFPYSGTPNKEGFIFEGWIAADGRVYKAGDEIRSDLTVHASFREIPVSNIKNITVDVSRIEWFADEDAVAYIYAYYKNGDKNADFPGIQMNKKMDEDGIYVFELDVNNIAGIVISRCSGRGEIWNKTNDITEIPEDYYIVIREMMDYHG